MVPPLKLIPPYSYIIFFTLLYFLQVVEESSSSFPSDIRPKFCDSGTLYGPRKPSLMFDNGKSLKVRTHSLQELKFSMEDMASPAFKHKTRIQLCVSCSLFLVHCLNSFKQCFRDISSLPLVLRRLAASLTTLTFSSSSSSTLLSSKKLTIANSKMQAS